MNRNSATTAILVLFVSLASRDLAWSQCAACKWSDRGDRFEGIASRQVSGGCCELLGVHFKRTEKVDANAPKLTLFFWLPESANPEIVVWQPSTNYMMVPKEKKYLKGLQRFSWPRQAVIEPLGVNIDTLYTRVHDSNQVYFPALLSTSEKPKAVGSYLFVLESGGAIDARCTVERETNGKLTPIRSFRYKQDFGGVFQVAWDGLDDQGRPAAAGTYLLRLKGSLEAETIEDLNYTVRFQHYGRFE
jgi:hypothetical protein